ncbi:hypothetical protein EDD11_008794, partial [Mortierella claussenii]
MSTFKQGSQQYQTSTRLADVDIRPYLPWALKDRGKEHVSYTNFVEEFDLKDRAHSQLLYSNLIEASDIKLSRRKKLRNQYTSFSKHKFDNFWAARTLELERSKTCAHSAITAARTARLAQTASVYESSLGFRSYQDQHKNAARDDNGSKSDGDVPVDAVNIREEVSASDARVTLLRAPLSPNEGDRHHVAASSGRRLSNSLLTSKAQPISNTLYQSYRASRPASNAKSGSKNQAKRTRTDFLVIATNEYSTLTTVMIVPFVLDNQGTAPATGAIQSADGKLDSSAGPGTSTSISVPSKRSAQDALEADDANMSISGQKPVHKRITILEAEFLSESGSTTSSQLTTNDRLIFNEVDFSVSLMDARRSLVKKQNDIKECSDLLAINFIFDEIFLNKRIPKALSTSLCYVPVPTPSESELKLLVDCSVFVATHSFADAQDYVWDKIHTERKSLVATILLHYTSQAYLWKQGTSFPVSSSSLGLNEDTYTHCAVRSIIRGILRGLEVVDHWGRDSLPTPQGFEELYLPDFFADFDNLPLFVVEIKKPGAKDLKDVNLEGDQRKLPCMMKLVLNTVLQAGVLVPAVMGLLVKG